MATSCDERISAPRRRACVEGAPRQVRAGEARREAEVVFDAARGAGLPPGRLALDEERAQPLTGSVHGGRQPGRPAPDDDEIVERVRSGDRHADRLGELAGRWCAEDPAVGEADDGLGRLGRRIERGGEAAALLVGDWIEPDVRDLVAGQEVAQTRGRVAPIGC